MKTLLHHNIHVKVTKTHLEEPPHPGVCVCPRITGNNGDASFAANQPG